MITDILQKSIDGQDLDYDEASAVMDSMLDSSILPSQFGALVTALRLKGETASELAGFAESMGRHAVRVNAHDTNLVDTCGTGGGKTRWLGISTTAAFVAAGAGATVAKHGNRGVTRPAGSSNVLEALGVNVMADANVVSQSLAEARVGFMFAQVFHPAMRFVAPLRRELGFRTLFNILGPLTNPAGAQHRLLGVGDPHLLDTIGQALGILGVTRALVVHGHGDVDEISLSGPTQVVDVHLGQSSTYELSPDDFHLPVSTGSDLLIDDPCEVADLTRSILSGSQSGPRRNVVLANASAALVACGIARDWHDGVERATEAIHNGSAHDCLDKLIEVSNRNSRA